ncbi:response regulator transcription factor [Bacteriovorax sp. Seq25_V]|uniref:response regulator transcription factor n=1 Tax=Bacteriovorax sp. Seq25_V TaxID=1201288 RepID=UPI000389F423|nr:response regulator transcription factor [Bacteriovorax sp. Seq25_V]EQC46089.1 response regulator receiver domain protein [Bacteriovorax sp. Seq25_V]
MNREKRILVIEDEFNIAKGIELNLELQGHIVTVIDRGDKGLEEFKEGCYDLLVLDLMLPGLSGEQVLKEVRAIDEKFPVLILSAKDEAQSKINCFNLGTDDYLAKPFHIDEFLLRVERLLKRSSWVPKSIEQKYIFGDSWIDLQNMKAYGSKKEINLTRQECVLLELFITNEGKALKRSEILLELGLNEETSTRTIDNFIVRFRKYFEKNPKDPKHFISLRSVGYLFSK